MYHPGSGGAAAQRRVCLGTPVWHLSHEARIAESRGLRPISRAVPEVAGLAGCAQYVARAALERVGSAEWHWVGEPARRVQYYDVSAAVDVIRSAQAKPG